MTKSWDKHAAKMRMRKTCERLVFLSHTLVDCQEIKFPASENHSSGTITKITVHQMKNPTTPSSTLTTSRCLVAIVMTKMKAKALWNKDSIAILWKHQVDFRNSSRPSNCGLRLCRTCCSGGMGLFPLPVIAVYSWHSLLHVCFASLKVAALIQWSLCTFCMQ